MLFPVRRNGQLVVTLTVFRPWVRVMQRLYARMAAIVGWNYMDKRTRPRPSTGLPLTPPPLCTCIIASMNFTALFIVRGREVKFVFLMRISTGKIRINLNFVYWISPNPLWQQVSFALYSRQRAIRPPKSPGRDYVPVSY